MLQEDNALPQVEGEFHIQILLFALLEILFSLQEISLTPSTRPPEEQTGLGT